jgi:hypothetical protein
MPKRASVYSLTMNVVVGHGQATGIDDESGAAAGRIAL